MSEQLDWHPFLMAGEKPIWLLVTEEEKREYKSAGLHDCDHSATEYRDRTIAGGGIQRIRQCLNCGKSVGNAKKLDSQVAVSSWDNILVERAEQNRDSVRERIYEAALKRTSSLEIEGYADYEEYLRSEKWKQKRTAVLNRDSGICQACLSSEADQVHHLTYDRIFDEPLFDLVAICQPCHEQLHKKKIAAAASAQAKSVLTSPQA